MRRDPTQEEIDAVFAANDCPGPIHCKQPRTSEKLTADIWPCATCKMPARTMVGNTLVYRSFSDYCDD